MHRVVDLDLDTAMAMDLVCCCNVCRGQVVTFELMYGVCSVGVTVGRGRWVAGQKCTNVNMDTSSV